MTPQTELNILSATSVEKIQFEPIRGYPMLHWKGKRPFSGTQFYPAQLKETYGEAQNNWINKIFWGDNLQVMSHLLKEFRGKVDLVYIDPPFDSKADYKKKISLKGKQTTNDQNAFEEKQYTDIWTNDEYLQFMYERLILIRELLSEKGFLFLHCDYHKSHYLKIVLDEIFGASNLMNHITWVKSTNPKGSQHESSKLSSFTDSILLYAASNSSILKVDSIRVPLSEEELIEKYHRRDEKGPYYDGPIIRSITMGERPNLVYEYKGYTPPKSGWRVGVDTLKILDNKGDIGWSSNDVPFRKLRPEDDKGKPIGDFWNDISLVNSQAAERNGYPTQKPEKLLERILLLSTEPGDLVFDCFMGSGTTQAVAMKLGRRFIGADINLGAIDTTVKRLAKISAEIRTQTPQIEIAFGDSDDDVEKKKVETFYTGFEVYNVNHYDVFRNPVEAKQILLQALEVQPIPGNATAFDGEKDGRMVKIMPVNRIATRADLNELLANLNEKTYAKKFSENPTKPVESITLVCMGHDPDLAAQLMNELKPWLVDVEVVDILRDKSNLEFKRDSELKVICKDGRLHIEEFYPMNLLQKLSFQKESVEDYRELVDSVKIDWNYDGAIFNPTLIDLPIKNELVSGEYEIPKDAGTIRIKVTDLLSESVELSFVEEK